MSSNYLFTSESVSEGHPDKVAAQCRDAGLEVTDEQIEVLWVASDVSEQPISAALERLGLVYWQEPVAPPPAA